MTEFVAGGSGRRQERRVRPAEDAITTNHRIIVPFVRPDTYSGILDYVATTL
ncbi:hypothetical protein ACWEN6_04320 [Sphaerisporangium sp. NPDC004334]